MINEKITIILPIYNSEKFLYRCLNSIVNQTYNNIEIICINDGSIDNSLNIINEFARQDNRIKVIDKKNEGVSIARNVGIDNSTGKYITFVDSDDWIELDFIETLYNTLINEKVDAVRANYFKTNDNEIPIGRGNLEGYYNVKLKKSKDISNLLDMLLIGKIPCYIWLLLIKKEILENIRFKENISIMEDKIFYVKLLNNINSIYILDKSIYYYYDNNLSTTRSKQAYIKNIYNAIDANKEIKNIIINSEFNAEYKISILNTADLNMISNNLFILYCISNIKKNDIIFNIKKIINNKEVKNMFNNVDYNLLPYHLNIPIKLMKNKQIKLLVLIYNLRYIFLRFRNFIFRRKN